jgi:hypothetical protein
LIAGSASYSITESYDRKYGHLVEVLSNGGPVHSYDRNFRFGPVKAELMLTGLPALERFAFSTDEERLLFEPEVFKDSRLRLGVRTHVTLERETSVTMQPGFVRSTGEYVERPWLNFQSLQGPFHIGLGAVKCKAIWAVRESLKEWLERVRSGKPKIIARLADLRDH